MLNKKKIWLSKTFYLGVITAVAPLFSEGIQNLIRENLVTFGILWGAATVVLRLVTKDKVTLIN